MSSYQTRFEYDDYAAVAFTAVETSYIIGTNAVAADPALILFEAGSILLFATQDCWVRFNSASRVQHFIPANTYFRYGRRTTVVFVVRDAVDGTLRLYIEG